MDDVKREIEDLKASNRRIVATLVRLEGKIDDMGENMATKEDVNQVIQKVDGLAGRLEDLRFRYAVHADTLQRHDARLKKLESRRS